MRNQHLKPTLAGLKNWQNFIRRDIYTFQRPELNVDTIQGSGHHHKEKTSAGCGFSPTPSRSGPAMQRKTLQRALC
jgi:hypothetical protein